MLVQHFFGFLFLPLAYGLFVFVTLSLSSLAPLSPPLSQSGEDQSSGLSQERSQTQEARLAGSDTYLSSFSLKPLL